MIWLLIFIPVVTAAFLLVFFFKRTKLCELAVLLLPSALIILIMNAAMIRYSTTDKEYRGAYSKTLCFYEAYDEEVPCTHSYDCNCSTDKDGRRSCSTCYQHSYDVDYHPKHWTKKLSSGQELEISESEFNTLKQRFASTEYFVDLHRSYHSIDGDVYKTDFKGQPDRSDVITTEHSYINRIQASHSVFKLENIDEKTKKMYGLYDYPTILNNRQQVVLGKKISPELERKIQYLNGYYGASKQFKLFILFFNNPDIDVAFKQRSYWEGGNKNEFTICLGTDKSGKFAWVKCFSWMDTPALEVEVESFFTKNKDLSLEKFADWMPVNIVRHWHRKQFKDFDYLQVELTQKQMMWILIILLVYNIAASIWIVCNEFKNEYIDSPNDMYNYDGVGYYDKRKKPQHIVKKSSFQIRLEEMQRQRNNLKKDKWR